MLVWGWSCMVVHFCATIRLNLLYRTLLNSRNAFYERCASYRRRSNDSAVLQCSVAFEVDRIRSRQTELGSFRMHVDRTMYGNGNFPMNDIARVAILRASWTCFFVGGGVKEERWEHLRFFLHGIFFYLAFLTRVKVASGISDLVETNNNEKRKLLVEEIQLTDKVEDHFTPISNVLRDFKLKNHRKKRQTDTKQSNEGYFERQRWYFSQ